MIKKDITVTIVVPCYNVDEYIEKCAKSIIAQTYKKLEILFVDDGSVDKTGEILDELNDNRVEVMHINNGGLSNARNIGIEKASGKYICFIDGDDYIEQNYVEKLLTAALKADADIVACGFCDVDESGRIIKKHSKVDGELTLSGRRAVEDYLSTKNTVYSMAWNKIYKTELFKSNDIKYPVGRLHEDEYTTYKLYYYSKKVAFTPEILYCYLQRKGSIMNKKFSIVNLEDVLYQIEDLKIFAKDNNFEQEESRYIEAYEINMKRYMLKLIIKNKIETPRKAELVSFLKANRGSSLKNRYATKMTKLACLLPWTLRI